VYYWIKFHWYTDPAKYNESMRVDFAYAVINTQRQFSIDPNANLPKQDEDWLEKYCQRLPRQLLKARPDLPISKEFFNSRWAHIELSRYGVIKVVPNSGGVTDLSAPGAPTPEEDGTWGNVPAAMPDSMRPHWWYPLLKHLADSPDPNAQVYAADLLCNPLNKRIQQNCSRIITADRMYNPAAAVAYLGECMPNPYTAAQPPTPTPTPAIHIADDDYDPAAAARSARIARIAARREARRETERADAAAGGSND
jgi:hypothetical protein